MRAKTRSATGGLLMLLSIPFIVGLLACLPVPIGNPEKSRIDSALSGVWISSDLSDGPGFFVFEPYDRRTWLLTSLPLEAGADLDLDAYDVASYAGMARLMESGAVDDGSLISSEVALYKVWRTKLGGEWFLTWEPKGIYDNEAFVPEVWFAFRIERPDADTLDLYLVNGENDLFKEVEETRRAYERVLRKHARDADVYSDEPVRLWRLQPEHRDFFEALAKQVLSTD